MSIVLVLLIVVLGVIAYQQIRKRNNKIDELIHKIHDDENKNNELNDQNTKLNSNVNDLKSEVEDLNQKLDFKLSVKQMDAMKLNDSVIEINNEIKNKQTKLKALLSAIDDKNEHIENLKAEIGDLTSESEISEYGLQNPNYEFENAWQYKDAIKDIRQKQKELVKNKTAVDFNPNWVVNNSKALGQKMTKNEIKSILRSFNNECTEAIKKVRYTNYERIAKRIKKSFEQHNKIYSVNEIQITNEYLNLKLKELDLAFKYQCKKEDEREALQEERQREKENKALEREANKKKQQIKKDIDHYSKAIKELNLRLEKEKENQGLKDEIAKLKEQISSKEDTDASIDSQLYNPQAGYVYIISNIGSFGKDVVKIGVTRRLKPEERIKELSSASVPFKFDTHALIFSSNAFDLETKLHHRFDEQRINMVNNRKEFFRVPIEEIEKELQKYDNVTVDFNEVPEADEYRQTLKIRNEENDSKDINELLKTN